MEHALDQPMTNGHNDGPPLSPDEQRVLALYDRLQELRLEVAIINAQKSRQTGSTHIGPRQKFLTHSQTDTGDDATEEEMRNAQNGLLEARAKYRLRNDVVEAVMMANPILKAVHSSTEASPIEQHVEPKNITRTTPLTII